MRLDYFTKGVVLVLAPTVAALVAALVVLVIVGPKSHESIRLGNIADTALALRKTCYVVQL